MWWRLYGDLSVRVIDSLLGSVSSKGSSADRVKTNSNAVPSAELEKMLSEISTQMVEISQQQKEALKAEIASHARAMALSEISHDLRTPLNAIIGFTQMMESGIFGSIGNAQYTEYLRHIQDSGYELLERIEELLDTAPSAASEKQSPSGATPAREFVA